MKDYIQDICQHCYEQLPDGIENFFLHCTFEEGVVGPSLYYKTNSLFPRLVYISIPSEISMLLYEFWTNGINGGKKDKWEIACINFRNGKFSIDLIYPNQITDEERNNINSRERYIKKYFGKIKVEYPKFG